MRLQLITTYITSTLKYQQKPNYMHLQNPLRNTFISFAFLSVEYFPRSSVFSPSTYFQHQFINLIIQHRPNTIRLLRATARGTLKINNINTSIMSSSCPLKSALKQNNNSTCASKLSTSTNKPVTNRDPKVLHRKYVSIGNHEAFCDAPFDVPPGKPTEEVRKVFN